MDLSRSLLEPAQQFFKVTAHVEFIVNSLELSSVFVYISLQQIAQTLSFLVKNIFEEINCRLNLVKYVEEEF